MEKVNVYEAVINEDIRRKSSEVEREIEDQLAKLPIPPGAPPEMANVMRRSGPMLAYCLTLTMKGVMAKWN